MHVHVLKMVLCFFVLIVAFLNSKIIKFKLFKQKNVKILVVLKRNLTSLESRSMRHQHTNSRLISQIGSDSLVQAVFKGKVSLRVEVFVEYARDNYVHVACVALWFLNRLRQSHWVVRIPRCVACCYLTASTRWWTYITRVFTKGM